MSNHPIKQFVERVANLITERNSAKLRRKSHVEALKAGGLPAAELIALAKRDEDKAKEKSARQLDAAALLGVTAYSAETEPESLTDRGYNDDVKELIDEHLDGVLKEDEEIGGINADIKEVLKEAKTQGFAPKLIEQCAVFTLDPKAIDDYRENQDALFNIYWKECA